MAKVNLYYTADSHPIKTLDFPRLDGGLNIRELDYRLNPNESPDMLNLWWKDGVLQCRDGQKEIVGSDGTKRAFTCTAHPFHGVNFFHIGSEIVGLDIAGGGKAFTAFSGDTAIPLIRGTFFEYQDDLYYKTRGQIDWVQYDGYKLVPRDLSHRNLAVNLGHDYPDAGFYRIRYIPRDDGNVGGADPRPISARFSFERVVDSAYTPIIFMNGDPVTGSGSLYQPENRLSVKKTVQYNAVADVSLYKLPVSNIDGVTEVYVDGVRLYEGVESEGGGFSVDTEAGIVQFYTAPPVHDPPVNNTVEITYRKSNDAAFTAFSECRFMITFGSGQDLCVIAGGSLSQPNAFLWNGHDAYNLNAGYWPISHYNLAGTTDTNVTGFGVQYGVLFVFKEDSVGRASYGVEDVDGRQTISFTYTNVNREIGCDLPWSIQLIDNNLVFANTRGGVYLIRDSNWANENSIIPMSRKINGTDDRRGLLYTIREMTTSTGRRFVADNVASWDDGERYWLVGGDGDAWLWDYHISDFKNPSWFPQDNIGAVAFFSPRQQMMPDTAYAVVTYSPDFKTYLLDQSGRVRVLEPTLSDAAGAAIKKHYQFPPQYFGSYDRLKDIMYVIFQVRNDTYSNITIQYDTDYETRLDKTNIYGGGIKLVPRNLARRDWRHARYARVARRKPCTRHLRHFAMRLENNEAFADLTIVGAQIYYRFLGKDR